MSLESFFFVLSFLVYACKLFVTVSIYHSMLKYHFLISEMYVVIFQLLLEVKE
jgi:hypothetical protein